MALVKQKEHLSNWWGDPAQELQQMSNRMNQIFGRFFGDGGSEALSISAGWLPTTNVSENEKEYRITVELPAVKKEDVKVTMQDGVMTIEGERKKETEEKGEHFHRTESVYGRFMRRFSLPDDADPTKIDASFKDGMLEVHITKQPAKAKPKAQEVAIH